MRRKDSARPRLFIGSPEEGRDLAYAIHENLDDDVEATVWKQGVFELTKGTLESLMLALEEFDFAVFVFSGDDILRIRKRKHAAVRDNVIFELGLFMGRLGAERVFAVAPKNKHDLRIPTDLAGLTIGTFDANRSDKNLEAALGPFCSKVRRRIKSRPAIKRGSGRTARLSPSAKSTVGKRSAGLVVKKAEYGIRDHRVDVTRQLNSKIKRSRLHVFVGNQLAGDPCPNIKKNLIVEYSFKGQRLTKTIDELEDLDLP